MEIISLLVAVLYTLVVVGICAYLLSRGFTHSFLLWFGGAAVLQAVPRIGFHVLQRLPGGVGANDLWLPAFSVLGLLGALCFMAGFVSLAAFLLRTRAPEA